jgi:hypothetical protein
VQLGDWEREDRVFENSPTEQVNVLAWQLQLHTKCNRARGGAQVSWFRKLKLDVVTGFVMQPRGYMTTEPLAFAGFAHPGCREPMVRGIQVSQNLVLSVLSLAGHSPGPESVR